MAKCIKSWPECLLGQVHPLPLIRSGGFQGMFGPLLGSHAAITATIGRRAVMEAAQSTFISSTFWTERIGPTAALKTLEVMERERSWETITKAGEYLRLALTNLAQESSVSLSFSGIPALLSYSFQSKNSLAYKTLISQEMLHKGYLASTSTYLCVDHTKEVIDQYIEALKPVFMIVGECESGRDIMPELKGPICHSGFTRLN